MMFRLLPAAAMTATALAAMTAGAATVDVYGVVDTGLHYVKADSGDTSVTMDSGISKGSRVGLIGSEDLGGGYKIVFNLETGFSLDDGSFDNTKNRLFNRNAYLGVASPYGEVRFGRQGALGSGVNGSIFLNSYTVFGNSYKEAQALQIINHQVMRADNMIRYESPDMAGLRLYGEYSNGVDGDDAVPSSQRDRFAALGAQYRRGPLRVVFVADNYFYERGSSPYNRDDSQTYNLGIRWKLDDLTLYGEYSNGVDGDDAVPSSQRDRFAALGAQYRRGPLRVVFVADNYFYERGSSPYNRDDSQTYNLGIRWKLDDLTLYGAYQYGHNVEKVGNQMTRHKDTKNTLCGNEGFDSHAVVLGATHEVLGGKLKIQTGYVTGDYDTFTVTVKSGKRTDVKVEADAWQIALGYDYPLSKRTYLYAAASYVDRTYKENGKEVSGSKKTDTVRAAMLGICHSF